MNEQIRELAEQAGITTNLDTDFYEKDMTKWVDYFSEKFAELIVRECLNQCYNRGMNDELYAGQLKAATYIEEHFGVKL